MADVPGEGVPFFFHDRVGFPFLSMGLGGGYLVSGLRLKMWSGDVNGNVDGINSG